MDSVLPCLICFLTLITPGTVVLQCSSCISWAHNSCLGISASSATAFQDWKCLKCLVPNCRLLSASPYIPADVPYERGFFANVRSLSKNFDYVKNFVLKQKPLFFGVVESWLTSHVTSEEVGIPGYNLFRRDRGTHAGGVACYLRSDISATAVISPDHEILTLKTPFAKLFSSISILYRPDSVHPDDYTSSLIEHLSTINCSKAILGGDLNLDPNRTRDSTFVENIYAFCKGLGLRQLIRSATRSSRHSASIIDWIISYKQFKPCIFPPLGSADHCVTGINIPNSKTTCENASRPVGRRDFKKTNWEAVFGYLNSPPVQVFSSNVNLAVTVFTRFFQFILTAFTPVTFSHQSHKIPWFSKDIKKLISKRNQAYQLFQSTRSDDSWSKYITLRNTVVSEVRKQKTVFLSKFKDPCSFWKFHRNSKPKSDKLKSLGAAESKTLADKLACEFVVPPFVGPFPEATPLSGTHTLSIPVISISDVLFRLRTLKIKSAGGHDGIPAAVIKTCAHYLAPILVNIFNVSLGSGIYPAPWKNALITPIPKNSDLNTFRPISLLPHFSKIFERLIFNNITKFLNDNNILNSNQFGYRQGKSTTDALSCLSSKLHSFLNSSKYAICVFFDCSKAFDSICHYYLIYRLTVCGLSPSYISWFSDYLTFRTHRVRINNLISFPKRILAGVPQGSILGPLLFNICIDSFSTVNLGDLVKHILYADDLVIFRSFSLRESFSKFQTSVDSVAGYFSSIGLNLNTTKTKLMIFSNVSNIFTECFLKLNNLVIERVNEFKYLGVIFSSNLRQSSHANYLVKKCNKTFGFLFRKYKACNSSTKKLLFQSLVLSRIDYGITCCLPFSQKCISRLNKLFVTGHKFIFGVSASDPMKPWVTSGFKGRFNYYCGLLSHKFIFAGHLGNEFPLSLTSSRRSSRLHHGKQLEPIFPNTETFRISTQYNMVSVWNSLSQDLANTMSHNNFKAKLSKFLRTDL